MESSDEEEEAEFRHLLEENTNTPSTQRRGHYTNSILSAAVSSLCPYKRGPQKFTTGEFIKARRVGDLSAEEVKSSTKKIMSLPFTVVSSARGTRELLDLTRLHYVTHRLALGEEGLEDMIAAEKKIVGHSIFANTSSLAVLAMPVMDFEEGAQANGTANQLVQNDPTVRKHLQDMEIAIETMRAEKLDEVRIMDCSMFHSKRRQCLNNMQERAMMMDSSLQDVLFDGINRTDDICSHNPGFNELEIIRAGTATVNFNSSPSLMKMETKVSPRSIHFASESEAEADAKDKIGETMQADSPVVSPRSVASPLQEGEASLERNQDLSKKENSATTLVLQGTESYTSVPVAGIDPQESLATDSGATHQFSSKRNSSYWGKAQDSVYKRSERKDLRGRDGQSQ